MGAEFCGGCCAGWNTSYPLQSNYILALGMKAKTAKCALKQDDFSRLNQTNVALVRQRQSRQPPKAPASKATVGVSSGVLSTTTPHG